MAEDSAIKIHDDVLNYNDNRDFESKSNSHNAAFTPIQPSISFGTNRRSQQLLRFPKNKDMAANLSKSRQKPIYAT